MVEIKMNRDFEVIINGNLKPTSFKIQLEEEKHLTAAFVECFFFDPHSSYINIKLNDTVQIRDITANKVIFDGYVSEIPKRKSGKVIGYEFDCYSKWGKSQNHIVNRTFTNILLSDVLKTLLNDYSSQTGITPGEIEATTYVMKEIKFEDETLYDCVQKITDITGFNYQINENNTLDFKRYELTRNYNDLWEDNIRKDSARFQASSSMLCNRVVAYGENKLRVVVEDATSLSKYGTYDKLLRFDLPNEADIREAAQNYLNAYKEPLFTGAVDVMENRTWKAGQLIAVHIPKLGLNGELLRISRIRTQIDKGPIQISLTFNEPPRVAGTMAQIMKRLRDVEKSSGVGSDAGSQEDINAVYQVLYHNGLISSDNASGFTYNPEFDVPDPNDDGHAGSGSASDPILIRNAQDFDTLIRQYATQNVHFRLKYNIDFATYDYGGDPKGWLPINGWVNLDGAGRVIKNLYCNRPLEDNVGLFGILNYRSYIKNLGIINPSITGRDNVGGLAGTTTYEYTAGGTLLVDECFVIEGNITGTNKIGGLIGYSNAYFSVHNSFTNIRVNSDGINPSCYIAGMIGLGPTNDYIYTPTFYNCYSASPIMSTSSYVSGFSNGKIRADNCYFDTQRSGKSTSSYGIGKLTFAMIQQANYQDWNFVEVWTIEENRSYPTLLQF